MAKKDADPRGYWRANLRLMSALLLVWFVVSYGLGILLVEPLNAFHLWGFPLGFWFAQQGSIYVFVVLILIYALAMDRLDRRHGVE
jgi:putative solute:sodium symporter small subunit